MPRCFSHLKITSVAGSFATAPHAMRLSDGNAQHQNKRQTHSIKRDTTSPNTRSTADQMNADTKLAI